MPQNSCKIWPNFGHGFLKIARLRGCVSGKHVATPCWPRINGNFEPDDHFLSFADGNPEHRDRTVSPTCHDGTKRISESVALVLTSRAWCSNRIDRSMENASRDGLVQNASENKRHRSGNPFIPSWQVGETVRSRCSGFPSENDRKWSSGSKLPLFRVQPGVAPCFPLTQRF